MLPERPLVTGDDRAVARGRPRATAGVRQGGLTESSRTGAPRETRQERLRRASASSELRGTPGAVFPADGRLGIGDRGGPLRLAVAVPEMFPDQPEIVAGDDVRMRRSGVLPCRGPRRKGGNGRRDDA